MIARYIIILLLSVFYSNDVNKKIDGALISISYKHEISFLIDIDRVNENKVHIKYCHIEFEKIKIDSIITKRKNFSLIKKKLNEFEKRIKHKEIKPTMYIDSTLFHNSTFINISYRNSSKSKIKNKSHKIYGGYYGVESFLKEIDM